MRSGRHLLLQYKRKKRDLNNSFMTEQEFIRLLRRFEKGQCTPEEQDRLELWLDQVQGKQSPFESSGERDRVGEVLREAIHAKAGIPKGKVRTMVPRAWMRVAAAVLLLALACYGVINLEWVKFGDQMVSVQANAQDRIRKILLPDGSIVWLKGESKLTYPEVFESKKRVVTLTGEALFEVSKNPNQPFIIHTGDLTTRVLGTSFNIRNTQFQTEVYVLTGKVSVSLPKTNQQVELQSNEKALYSHASNELQKEGMADSHAVIEYVEGTEYDMAFEDTRVDEIARRIETKFGVEVRIKGEISSCVITADLTDQSLSNTLDIISEALNGTYEIRGDDVILQGEGCR